MILYDDYVLNKKEKIRFFAAAGLLAGAVGWLFYKNPVMAIAMMVLPVVFLKKYRLYMAAKRRTEINIQFKDVLYSFSDSAASGKQAGESVLAAHRNLVKIYGEDKVLTREFGRMSIRIREMNEAPESLLMEFAERSGVEDIRNFMEIYCICIKSGGDKEKAISKAAGIIGEKINLRRELNTVLAQKKLEAAILCVIPLVVLGFLQLTSSDYGAVLYNSIAGRLIMTGCLGAGILAAGMCVKIMDVKI